MVKSLLDKNYKYKNQNFLHHLITNVFNKFFLNLKSFVIKLDIGCYVFYKNNFDA